MNIILLGYGKMGQMVKQKAEEQGHSILAVANSAAEREAIPIEILTKAQVAIEFTEPTQAVANIQWCVARKLPIVVGTTGWYENYEEIKKQVINSKSALLTATNFSLGVNLFFAAAKKVAEIFAKQSGIYKPSITEIHHTSKKDAPSGTAITLAESILPVLPHYENWVLGTHPEAGQLPIEALRLPDVPGTHELYFSSATDNVVLSHIAHNREGFANGAIVAAEFLQGKKGVFTMKDVLGLDY